MAKKIPKNIADFVVPLFMNGLRGRMLRIPYKGTFSNKYAKELLLIYPPAGSIECVFEIAAALTSTHTVTVPDLPGCGRMDPFSSINLSAYIDTYAQYVSSFVQLRYKRKRLSILACGSSFAIVTRTLQMYPDIAKKVDLVVNYDGYVHHEDLKLSKFKKRRLLLYTMLGARLPLYQVIYAVSPKLKFVLQDSIYEKFLSHAKSSRAHQNLQAGSHQHIDIRSNFMMQKSLARLNLCNTQLDVKCMYISMSDNDKVDAHIAFQHCAVVYHNSTHVRFVQSNKGASSLIPRELSRVLNSM